MDDGLTALKGSAMEALEGLILKLSVAVGGDRALDNAISLSVIYDFNPDEWPATGGLPPYTYSVDAALSLIPKGWSPGLETPRNAKPLYGWRLYEPMHRSVCNGTHRSMAIALCIAALRARLAEHLKAPTRRPLAQEPNPMTPKQEGEGYE